MTPTHDQLRTWDRELLWHAFTQMSEYEPLVIQEAHGCILTDIEGRQFIDGVSSLWCNVHGHRHPRLDQAIRDQLDKVAHVTSLGMSNPTTIQLARRLVDLTPETLQHVFFSDDGATAIEVALKMAFQYWHQCTVPRPQKTKYIAYSDAYHGDTLGSVSVGGVSRFHEMFQPLLFDVIRLPSPSLYRRPPGVSAECAADFYLSQLESVLAEQHEKVAALVLEPLVQGAAGMVTQPIGYLEGVRRLTKKYDVLMIADEVAMGMGRTGKMFACEHEAVSPDFLCLAKGITGGYLPLAATLTTTDVWNAFLADYSEFKTFYHGHTYGGNPLGAAAAIACLDIFSEENTLEQLQLKIRHLAEQMKPLWKYPHVGDVRQCGLLAGIELVQNRETKEPFPWTEKRGAHVCEYALSQGVWLRPLGNVVVIIPPLSISLDQINKICDVVEEGISRVTQGSSV
ncbi:MAG: adenosylmethionine--8-amino-7-oxononanoate transaminase [Planctomycetaceae bacterium]|nr:adenosylmethionine--8-amino-7-oxononanoate transaminase [Planctomycetaceae bacterium]MBP60748.1 adenosylmethionine--8-amino-7-oxononanoate transaminase [Planctomycetaceae bacterium]